MDTLQLVLGYDVNFEKVTLRFSGLAPQKKIIAPDYH